MWKYVRHGATNEDISLTTALQLWESLLFPDEKVGQHPIDTSSKETLVWTALGTLNTTRYARARITASGPGIEATRLLPRHITDISWWNTLHFIYTYFNIPEHSEQSWWEVKLTLRPRGDIWSTLLELKGDRGPLPDRISKALKQAVIEIPVCFP